MNRILERAKNNSNNKWAWYEVAKNIFATSVDQLYDYAKRYGIPTNREAMLDGYLEWKVAR